MQLAPEKNRKKTGKPPIGVVEAAQLLVESFKPAFRSKTEKPGRFHRPGANGQFQFPAYTGFPICVNEKLPVVLIAFHAGNPLHFGELRSATSRQGAREISLERSSG